MASHEQNINNLKNARHGKDVRNSMIELFNEDYNLVKNGIAAGTDVNGPSSSTEGYSDGNVYINTDTLDIYKLENATWTNKGNLKGIKTITTEETTDDDGFNAVTFELTNGWQKTFHIKNGSKGSRGNGITGVTSERSGARVTYTLHFTDGDDYSFDVVDGTGASWGELTEKPFAEIKDTYLDVVDDKLTIKGLSIDESALDYSVNQKLNLGSYDDKWDPEHEYKKDDICIKNNRLYISKVNDNFMNDPEYDTSATYWKRTTYKDVISDLKNTLTETLNISASDELEVCEEIVAKMNSIGIKRFVGSLGLPSGWVVTAIIFANDKAVVMRYPYAGDSLIKYRKYNDTWVKETYNKDVLFSKEYKNLKIPVKKYDYEVYSNVNGYSVIGCRIRNANELIFPKIGYLNSIYIANLTHLDGSAGKEVTTDVVVYYAKNEDIITI